MARNYALRPLSFDLPSDWFDTGRGREGGITGSTMDGSSSPLISNHPTGDGIPFLFLNLDDLLSNDIYDTLRVSPGRENPTSFGLVS